MTSEARELWTFHIILDCQLNCAEMAD